jgi:tRNA threonylcarbamoyladenosine biosynthesis protein TsaE
MTSERRLVLRDAGATEALGRAIGERLRSGQGLALVGELGAGKTCLVRGVAHGLRLDDPDAVCSPTYLLVVEHGGPVPLLHMDAYLPQKLRRFLADGGLDYLQEAGGVIAVEWADRVADLLPEPSLWVELRPGPETHCGRSAILRDPSGAFAWLDTLDPARPD